MGTISIKVFVMQDTHRDREIINIRKQTNKQKLESFQFIRFIVIETFHSLIFLYAHHLSASHNAAQ